MANYTNLKDLFTAMANAIRLKKGDTGAIVADNFPTEISNLKTGFDYVNNSVTTLPDYAFYGCEELNSVDCYALTSVGESAFEGCENLKTVVLYDGVTDVGENAFNGCNEGLVIYSYSESQPESWDENWNPDDCEVVFVSPIETWDVSATSEDNVTAKLYTKVQDNTKYLLEISGNGEMKGYSSAYTAPWYESYRAKIERCAVFNSVTSIGDHAFRNCYNLSSITIPDSVTSIGEYAFYACTKLTSITIPDSVTSIGDSAFGNCSSLSSITIPDSVTSIGDLAFSSCAVKTAGPIGEGYDYEFGWTDKIPGNAFSFCTILTYITIPDGVTSIGSSAFSNCKRLSSITIPDSVTSIGDSAFYGCNELTSITYTGTMDQWNAITFGSNWNYSTGSYTVHCTDGDIAKV